MTTSWPVMPGVSAAGHVARTGAWHPGSGDACSRYPCARERFGVLFSHASEATFPGLVHGDYATELEAREAGHRTARASGVRFVVCVRDDVHGSRWRTRRGLAPVDALRRGEASNWRGWYR